MRTEVADLLEKQWKAGADGKFPCPIPGHEGGALIVRVDGRLVLGCCRGRWRSLAESYANWRYGLDAKRTNIELAAWHRKLAHEAGVFDRVASGVPKLPSEVPTTVRRVRDGFDLLLGLRWADYEPRPAAYSVRFTAAWCGVTFHEARLGLKELRRLDVIRKVEQVGGIPLYMPGDGPTLLQLAGSEAALVDMLARAFDASEVGA